MSTASEPNPFDLTKASDFTDDQIHRYWVDLADQHGLVSLLKPTAPMPLILKGSKGSGKTHLLRYCSSSVRRLHHGSHLKALSQDEYFGIYLRADGLNAARFSGKGQTDEAWLAAFQYYLENWICQLLITEVSKVLSETNACPDDCRCITDSVMSLFDTAPPVTERTMTGVLNALRQDQREMDVAVNNAALTRKLAIHIPVTPGRLLFGIPKVLSEQCAVFRGKRFVYLIDEVENFTPSQQTFLNGLIRYRTDPTTIRIGARLHGIKTFNTTGSGEPVKEGAEFELLILDELLRERSSEYHEFARRLCATRLRDSGVLYATKSKRNIEPDIDRYFEESGKEDPATSSEALRLVSRFAPLDRPHLRRLGAHLTEAFERLTRKETEGFVRQIIELCRIDGHPLVEKAVVYEFYKKWSRAKNFPPPSAINAANEIRNEAASYLIGERTNAIAQTLAHFKSDFLAQLYRAAQLRPIYAGFGTMVDMSQGVPRNLLSLLRHVYRRAIFNGERPFVEQKISLASQNEGLRDASSWFLDDALPDRLGTEIREAVERLAELFREVRFSDKPTECSLVAISLDSSALSQRGRDVLRASENWSLLIRVRDGAKDRNSKRIDEKFQLNPMLSPRWDLPEARRGTLPLSNEFAKSIFEPEEAGLFGTLLKRRVRGMYGPYPVSPDEARQLSFDDA